MDELCGTAHDGGPALRMLGRTHQPLGPPHTPPRGVNIEASSENSSETMQNNNNNNGH